MTVFGWHASHEQFAPRELLDLSVHAESAGFSAQMCSDHFHPWTGEQGQSGFAWSWLGAALQATRSATFGTVNAPGYRYHPAIIAQAAATLQQMYPGRFWVAVGSGEALNEHITGGRWPHRAERNARLAECIAVMRALWAGETVTHRGLITVEEATLFTRPETPPLLVGAALTPGTAAWIAPHVDALITISAPPAELRELIDAFRRGGGEGKPLMLQAGLSWDTTREAALNGAHRQWATQIFPGSIINELRTPAAFADLHSMVSPADVAAKLHVSADLEEHAEWLRQYVDLGFDEIYLHNVNTNQRAFIGAFAEGVLPLL